jgi:hypothetical protein
MARGILVTILLGCATLSSDAPASVIKPLVIDRGINKPGDTN